MFNPDFTDVPLVWKPDAEKGRQTKQLRKIIEDKYKVKFNDYRDFQIWSTDNLCEFWAENWDFLGIISSKRFHKVIDLNIPISESPKWYEGALLNYAENLLRYRDDRIALVQDGEDSLVETYTFAQIYEQSKLYAAAFRKFGLKKGDIVACYMSNRKEAVFALHAVTSIGAIWTGALPLLGSDAIVNRFKQVKPRILLTVDRFVHDGEEVDMLPKVKDAVQGLPSLEKVLIVASKPDSYSKDISGIKNSCFLEKFLKMGVEKNGSVSEMEFEQVSFSHPVMISYTSGTTGLPKAIVHGSGILMSICNCLGVTMDSDRDTVWLAVSPVGWASWTLYATLQFLGQRIILYEGNPYYLTLTCIWDLVDKHKISHILFPSSVVDELEKRKYVPAQKHELSSLKCIMAGGSVVKRGSFDFMNKILPHVLFSGVYGCTEVMGCCLVTEMSLPVFKAEINAACPGTAVEIVDDAGNPVIGEVGEVVLSKPFPGLALGMWGDLGGSAFREKYFMKYRGMFAMGDYGVLNPLTKGWIILCRRYL